MSGSIAHWVIAVLLFVLAGSVGRLANALEAMYALYLRHEKDDDVQAD